MQQLTPSVAQTFGNKVRLRTCGLCWQQNKLLLVKHRGLGPHGVLYAPPGGGLEFGTPLEKNLEREFAEETGLVITTKEFRFLYEYCAPPLHAIELYFSVEVTGGTLHRGKDPELAENEQIIQEVDYYSWAQIKALPAGQLHQILQRTPTPQSLKKLEGWVKFG